MAKGIRWRHGSWQIEAMLHGKREATSASFPHTEAGLRKAVAHRERWIEGLTGGFEYASKTPFKVIAQKFINQTDVKLSTHQSYIQLLNQSWMPTLENKPLS